MLLKIRCLTDESAYLSVVVEPHDDIEALQKAIRWALKQLTGRDIPLNALALYKVAISLDPEENRLDRARTYIEEHHGEALHPAEIVEDVFKLPLNPKHLQILVEVSDYQERTLIDIHYFVCERKDVSPMHLSLKIGEDERVSQLKIAIGRQLGKLGNVHLWKPHSFLSKDKREDLRSRLDDAEQDFGRFCDSLFTEQQEDKTIAQLFAEKVSQRKGTRTTLIAELLDSLTAPVPDQDVVQEAGDVLTKMRKRRNIAISEGGKSTPSVRSKPADYLDYQKGPAPILDGRYADTQNTIALPVELHHSAFAHFAAVARDAERLPPDDIVQLTIELMMASSQIATYERQRQSTTRDLFSKILGFPLVQTVHLNRTSADHVAIYAVSRPNVVSTAILSVFEEKSELGTSGEPSTQGSFSYLQRWTETMQQGLRDVSSCPSFIVALAGPWFVVLGAVITTDTIVQRLTDFVWLGDSRIIDDTRTFHLARILTALREGASRLRTFYDTFPIPANPDARFFPYATSFIDHTGTIVEFSYVKPLKHPESPSACSVFLAKTSTETLVVVKFVERYGDEAHQKLADIGKAPALLYHGDVWPNDQVASNGCSPRKMVVMEYINGKTCEGAVSDTVRVSVRQAIDYLHSQGMVHGDIRLPNVIVKEGQGDEESRVKVLDFDWAGPEGEARYPLRLSPGIWPDVVRDNQLILADHDMQMLERL